MWQTTSCPPATWSSQVLWLSPERRGRLTAFPCQFLHAAPGLAPSGPCWPLPGVVTSSCLSLTCCPSWTWLWVLQSGKGATLESVGGSREQQEKLSGVPEAKAGGHSHSRGPRDLIPKP